VPHRVAAALGIIQAFIEGYADGPLMSVLMI